MLMEVLLKLTYGMEFYETDTSTPKVGPGTEGCSWQVCHK